MYYSLRTAIPEFFDKRDSKLADFRESMMLTAAFPMPKPFDNGRIHIIRLMNDNVSKFSAMDHYRTVFMTSDIRMMVDYSFNDVYVFDVKHFKVGHLTKFTPNMVKKSIVTSQQGFCFRVKQIHFINSQSYVESFVNTIKPLLREKIANRIHFHKDMNSLYKCIPREYLPKDYGGDQKSIAELQVDWLNALDDWRDWFLAEENIKTDESRRPGKSYIDELFGTHGSFRKLDVD